MTTAMTSATAGSSRGDGQVTLIIPVVVIAGVGPEHEGTDGQGSARPRCSPPAPAGRGQVRRGRAAGGPGQAG